MMTDKDLTDDVLDEIIAGAKTSMEQYLALSLKAERNANRQQNSQQNIQENIPATQFKPVADLYGLTSPTGGETSFTFDAVEARDFIDGGWSCQEYVELERFQEAVSGNSPVIPDGVCPCCGRKPLKNRTCSVSGCDGKHVARGFCIKHYAIERKKDPSRRKSIRAADKRYRARKAAAPQQEAE